jgi:anti-anti-sigma factor
MDQRIAPETGVTIDMSTASKPMPPEFSYAFDSLKNAAIVRLRGRAGYEQMEVLDTCFKAVQALTDRQIILDLSELSYIGSAGLGAFVTLKRAVDARQGHIVLVGLNPMVYDLFDTAGFTKLFAIFRTVEEAVK